MIFQRFFATIMMLILFSIATISYASRPVSDNIIIQQTATDPLYTLNIARELWNVKWSNKGEYFAVWGWENATVYNAADGTVEFGSLEKWQPRNSPS